MKVLSYYLPQFHVVPENEEWWGPGFTEWKCLEGWRPYFGGHAIRRPVAPLGFYDLTNEDVFEAQQKIATSHGIDGFLVWDYWFGSGVRLLESPMELVLRQKIEFKYAFMWANHSWVNKRSGTMLMRQEYPGRSDIFEYFDKNIPHFSGENYLRVDGKPILGVFDPSAIPYLPEWVETMRQCARDAGLPGLFLIAEHSTVASQHASLFDKLIDSGAPYEGRKRASPLMYLREQAIKRFNMNFLGPLIYEYQCLLPKDSGARKLNSKEAAVVIAGWDTTPRHGNRGTVYKEYCRNGFRSAVRSAFSAVSDHGDDAWVVIKSWNEWAEGNVLEPDSVFGTDLLEVFREERSAFGRN